MSWRITSFPASWKTLFTQILHRNYSSDNDWWNIGGNWFVLCIIICIQSKWRGKRSQYGMMLRRCPWCSVLGCVCVWLHQWALRDPCSPAVSGWRWRTGSVCKRPVWDVGWSCRLETEKEILPPTRSISTCKRPNTCCFYTHLLLI